MKPDAVQHVKRYPVHLELQRNVCWFLVPSLVWVSASDFGVHFPWSLTIWWLRWGVAVVEGAK